MLCGCSPSPAMAEWSIEAASSLTVAGRAGFTPDFPVMPFVGNPNEACRYITIASRATNHAAPREGGHHAIRWPFRCGNVRTARPPSSAVPCLRRTTDASSGRVYIGVPGTPPGRRGCGEVHVIDQVEIEELRCQRAAADARDAADADVSQSPERPGPADSVPAS